MGWFPENEKIDFFPKKYVVSGNLKKKNHLKHKLVFLHF